MLRFKSRIRAAICVGLLYLAGGSIATGGTLMPPGMQTFFDNNGLPLSAGCVYFYIPGTTNPKNTYQNSAQTVANTNPVQLDAAGRAIIYGTGTYRQVVTASNGTLSPCSPAGTQIWDQLTASTDSSATIFAGASGGTPNAITVNAPAFSGTDGQVINFVSTNTNTGGATFNPSGFGAVQIVRDSATGPGALTGGELVATNAVSLIYDATAGTFHILSPVTWPNTSGVPVGTTILISGFTAPTNYAFAYGQAISRATFPGLLGALTFSQTGSISAGSPTITGLTDTTQFGGAQPVESVGIPGGALISSCTPTTCTMNTNATTTRTGTITVFAYGNGDGSTTFNLPDYRGAFLAGRDNMGGIASGRITQAFFGALPTSLGAPGGNQSTTLIAANAPSITSTGNNSISVASTSANFVNAPNGFASTNAALGGTNFLLTSTTATLSTVSSVGSNSISVTSTGTTSTPFPRLPPAQIVNYAIRLVP